MRSCNPSSQSATSWSPTAAIDDNESFGAHSTYRIAPAMIVPWTDTKLKASYGTGFKAPTLNQLFVSFPAFNFFANPNLLPEESLGYDAGFEQPFFNDRVRFGATYFHNDITNLINTGRRRWSQARYVNIEQGADRRRGGIRPPSSSRRS